MAGCRAWHAAETLMTIACKLLPDRRGATTEPVHLKLTSDADNGFLAGHISDVDEGVVERGEDAVGGKRAREVHKSISMLVRFGGDATTSRARRIDPSNDPDHLCDLPQTMMH